MATDDLCNCTLYVEGSIAIFVILESLYCWYLAGGVMTLCYWACVLFTSSGFLFEKYFQSPNLSTTSQTFMIFEKQWLMEEVVLENQRGPDA